ncbi:MAG: hypothetical protein AVDCRST_MAG31-2313, partial [uncultured Sphingomonas sp.]
DDGPSHVALQAAVPHRLPRVPGAAGRAAVRAEQQPVDRRGGGRGRLHPGGGSGGRAQPPAPCDPVRRPRGGGGGGLRQLGQCRHLRPGERRAGARKPFPAADRLSRTRRQDGCAADRGRAGRVRRRQAAPQQGADHGRHRHRPLVLRRRQADRPQDRGAGRRGGGHRAGDRAAVREGRPAGRARHVRHHHAADLRRLRHRLRGRRADQAALNGRRADRGGLLPVRRAGAARAAARAWAEPLPCLHRRRRAPAGDRHGVARGGHGRGQFRGGAAGLHRRLAVLYHLPRPTADNGGGAGGGEVGPLPPTAAGA